MDSCGCFCLSIIWLWFEEDFGNVVGLIIFGVFINDVLKKVIVCFSSLFCICFNYGNN